MKSAMIVIGWPEDVAWPADQADCDLAARVFRSGLDSRPRDEWVDIDLLELARYSKLLVQAMKAQDQMDGLVVGTKDHTAALRAVAQLSGVIATLARKLYIHKIIDTPRTAAHQAATERNLRNTLEGAAVAVDPVKPRPKLIA